MKKGILLLNLGTPQSAEPDSVGKYLKEFLMDPFVIDIPFIARWILVNLLIVPKRKHASSELYQKVWTDRGSPLMFHTEDLLKKVRGLLAEHSVKMCMRYGEPSIQSALMEFKSEGISELTVIPLYPQYSLAATESSIARVKEVASQIGFSAFIKFIPPFYHQASYLDAVASVSREHLQGKKYDKILFSFHGLPERQVKKTDSTGQHCKPDEKCSLFIGEANKNCYRAQSYATAREVASRLGLKEGDYLVGFQSRLGRTPWIKPYSDMYYETLPKEGVKRLAVISPSFVADCLETVEEIAMRGKKQFLESGGEDLFLVPSLNSDDRWAKAVTQLVQSS